MRMKQAEEKITALYERLSRDATILELAQKEREPGTPYLIIRAARPDQAELLTESCRQAFGQEPAMDCFIGGVIAINAGPNLVGLIYRKK